MKLLSTLMVAVLLFSTNVFAKGQIDFNVDNEGAMLEAEADRFVKARIQYFKESVELEHMELQLANARGLTKLEENHMRTGIYNKKSNLESAKRQLKRDLESLESQLEYFLSLGYKDRPAMAKIIRGIMQTRTAKVFGKSVPLISLAAIAGLANADVVTTDGADNVNATSNVGSSGSFQR